MRDLVHVFVRDKGCGINPEVVKQESHPHWGLRGMRERAEKIGGRDSVWSGTGAGTEVRIALRLSSLARRQVDRSPWTGKSHGNNNLILRC